ncbi:hypothetical protein ACPW7O_09790, partial [Streptomyces tunisiensis]
MGRLPPLRVRTPMTRPLTAAQRRMIEAADPGTGRLKGTEAQLTALVKRGLAFRHPRPPHDHFLTPAGHRAREAAQAQAEPSEPSDPSEPQAPASTVGVFAARAGGEDADGGGGCLRLAGIG